MSKRPPAPIDRPLSRSYLREFSGWSTAFPPGMSEATSLRVMHNCSIAPDNSLRIRPGLRHVLNVPAPGKILGSFEHFYLQDGRKAILFACRLTGPTRVVFRTAVYNTTTKLYELDPTIATRFPGATDADLQFNSSTTYVRYVQIDNKIIALSDSNEVFRIFWVGATRQAKVVQEITRPQWLPADNLTVVEPTTAWISGPQTTVPTARTPTEDSLISSTSASNVYNFAYFYTFNNEIGETYGSGNRLTKTQRSQSHWQGGWSGVASADQLVAIVPQAAWEAAQAQGATSWNLYMFTWSDQDSVPVEGNLLETKSMEGKSWNEAGWIAHTAGKLPKMEARPLTTAANRVDNFTKPSTAAQGLVAGDRLVLVLDRNNAARIQWTSNQQGDYLNFSASKGGGFKTLTSGNLYVPAAVKLWQNPQSIDTITVLCMGLDGEGTAYYMNASSTLTTQSQVQVVMGFEETTATPGTVSPYAVEVLNNSLYHPLDNNLMKSTASNYNINHSLMADSIQNIWHRIPLQDKQRMVSSQMDSTLYYLVNSPVGRLDAEGSNGNQVWLCDTALSGAWSCWDVVGTSLRKMEHDGLLYMSITSGNEIYVFDPEHDSDDYWDGSGWAQKGIEWEAVTNTQGANRAHDAWAMLQQVNVTFGNFTGECVYGIRGKDVNGKMVEVKKHYVAAARSHDPFERFHLEDFLQVRRTLKEWEFFWRSADSPKIRSYGSVGFIQYRYTPVSVNVGYEYGSVETFEYGTRAHQSFNAVPLPFADTDKA